MFKSEMWFMYIFCVILYTVLGQEKKITVYFPPDQVVAFRKSAETCGNQHGVDPKDLRKIVTWTLPDDQAHKQFLYCTLLHTDYIFEDGHINVEGASKIIPVNATQDEAQRFYQECDKIPMEDPVATAFELGTCYHKHFTVMLKKPEE